MKGLLVARRNSVPLVWAVIVAKPWLFVTEPPTRAPATGFASPFAGRYATLTVNACPAVTFVGARRRSALSGAVSEIAPNSSLSPLWSLSAQAPSCANRLLIQMPQKYFDVNECFSPRIESTSTPSPELNVPPHLLLVATSRAPAALVAGHCPTGVPPLVIEPPWVLIVLGESSVRLTPSTRTDTVVPTVAAPAGAVTIAAQAASEATAPPIARNVF